MLQAWMLQAYTASRHIVDMLMNMQGVVGGACNDVSGLHTFIELVETCAPFMRLLCCGKFWIVFVTQNLHGVERADLELNCPTFESLLKRLDNQR